MAAYTAGSSNTISYGSPVSCGDAMNVNLELRYAEGRLYAESRLAEFIKLVTGGSISIGVKYIPDAAQALLFDLDTITRGTGASAKVSHRLKGTSAPKYVGVGFYAPDVVDGVTKYTGIVVFKAQFGYPSMSLQTKGESIVFSTPTVTGEFLAADDTRKSIIDVGTFATESDATSWISTTFTTPNPS